MKAILCKSYGPPENLVVEEVEDPQAGPDQAVVEVFSASLNFPDLLQMQGKYQFQPPMPFSPGSEVGGIINSIGVDVKGARIWKGSSIALKANLTNAAFLRTKIEQIALFFADNEVSEIWITFPDPFLKKGKENRLAEAAICVLIIVRQMRWNHISWTQGNVSLILQSNIVVNSMGVHQILKSGYMAATFARMYARGIVFRQKPKIILFSLVILVPRWNLITQQICQMKNLKKFLPAVRYYVQKLKD